MSDEVENVIKLTVGRLAKHPDNPFLHQALLDLNKIKVELSNKSKINRDFYKSLVIDRLCATEMFEDVEYCKAVYAMIEAIYPEL